MKQIACLLSALFIASAALAQTTQPAAPEKLTDLFRPYEERMQARIAQLPNVPTQTQMDACKRDCDAIGDEFEQAIKLRYVWYVGMSRGDGKSAGWWFHWHLTNEREIAARRVGAKRPPRFLVSSSGNVSGADGTQTTITGQVLHTSAELFIVPDNVGANGRTDMRTFVAYPMLNAYLREGNTIPMTANVP